MRRILRVAPVVLTLSVAACESETPTRPPILDAATDTGSAVDAGVDTGSDTGTDAGNPLDTGVDAQTPTDAPDASAPVDRPDAGPPTGEFFCNLPGTDVAGVTVPEGFCVRRFARVSTARVLAFAPNGDVFVSSPATGTPGGAPIGRGAIVVLPDDNHDGVADAVTDFLGDIDSVHGLLFDGDGLLYTLSDGVYRMPYASGQRVGTGTPATHTRLAQLDDSVRWTHTLARGTDGNLYVSMGQYDTATCPGGQRAGSILRVGAGMPATGEVWVTGFRNPMYLRCREWGACYAAELSGDGWDSIGGREKLIEMRRGDNYGYPCCVDHNVPVPPSSMSCADVAISVQTYTLHDTPFGFDWAPDSWPAPYAGSFFVGLHGWVGSWTNTGVQWAPVDGTTHRPSRPTEFFLTGFGRGGAIPGRVTDLAFAPDGRMFFADDQDGSVYWVAPRTLRSPAR
ncbi:MAG: hypothetical protein R3A52_25810 [Polyangiales bacterium]